MESPSGASPGVRARAANRGEAESWAESGTFIFRGDREYELLGESSGEIAGGSPVRGDGDRAALEAVEGERDEARRELEAEREAHDALKRQQELLKYQLQQAIDNSLSETARQLADARQMEALMAERDRERDNVARLGSEVYMARGEATRIRGELERARAGHGRELAAEHAAALRAQKSEMEEAHAAALQQRED